MKSLDHWIDRQLTRLAVGQFLHQTAEGLALFFLVYGTAVLAVKLFIPALWPHVLWIGLGAMPVLLVSWWTSRQRVHSRSEAVALLDRRLQVGGLLMTLTESPNPDPEWIRRLPQWKQDWEESLPKIRPTRFVRYLSLPVLFVLGTLLVPVREARTEPNAAPAIGLQTAEELNELLTQFEEAAVLEEEEQQELRQEIEKLAAETRDTPLTHEKWETVDALRERMRTRLDSAALSTVKARDAAGALARAEQDDTQLMSADQKEQLQKTLSETLKKMKRDGTLSKASPQLRSELERLLKNDRFELPQDSEEREQLLNELKEFLDQESKKLEELRQQCRQNSSEYCEHCDQHKPGGT